MMCDLEERSDAMAQNEDQEKAREDIEELLDMIYKSSSVARKESIDDQSLIFPGRYMTKVVCVFPLEVSKRFVRPLATQPTAELIVHKLFGIQTLGNLLLLITPTATASRHIEKYIVHCYAVDTQWHLGVTSLTVSERDLIQNEQQPANYALIFCSSYIELEDAFMPTSIKGQLFDVLRKRSISPIATWYKGHPLSLQFWSSDPEQYITEKPSSPPHITGGKREGMFVRRNVNQSIKLNLEVASESRPKHKLSQSTSHRSSSRRIADTASAKGHVLGRSPQPEKLLRREREWVKFVGPTPHQSFFEHE
ncbi:hypothetical protein KR044_011301 [Drosophila immigrans]|nr:hypothetical protein KR044_011301 [Drosophila immigrans]